MRIYSNIHIELKETTKQIDDIIRQLHRVIENDLIHSVVKVNFTSLAKAIQSFDPAIEDGRIDSSIETNSGINRYSDIIISQLNSAPDVVLLKVDGNKDWANISKQLRNYTNQSFPGLIILEDEDFHTREFDQSTLDQLNIIEKDHFPEAIENIKSLILDDEVLIKYVFISWLTKLKNLTDVCAYSLEEKAKAVQAQIMLNDRYRLNINTNELRKISRQSNVIKSKITRQIKSLIQKANDRLQKDSIAPDLPIQNVYKQFNFYDGFSSEDVVRNTIIEVPMAFIDRSIETSKDSVKSILVQNQHWTEKKLKGIEKYVTDILQKIGIEETLEVDSPFDESNIDWILNDNMQVEADWTRSFTQKGMYHLFMELRTPMFMLLPFMMIGSLFAALLIGVDKGEINTSLTHNNSRQEVVEITRMPSKYFPDDPDRQGYLQFIEDLNKRINDGVFDRNTITILDYNSTIDRYNKNAKTVNYLFDPTTNYLTLFPISNRMEVIDILQDPSFKLLHQGGGNIRMGYSALFGLMAKVSDYKYLVFGGLMLLILWYGRKKFKDYKKEKVDTALKEKKSLRNLLRTQFEKATQNTLHAWQSNMSEVFRLYQDIIMQQIQKLIDEKVEEETQIAQVQKQLTDTRSKNFVNHEKEIQKIQKEIIQSNRELDRNIRDIERSLSRRKRAFT